MLPALKVIWLESDQLCSKPLKSALLAWLKSIGAFEVEKFVTTDGFKFLLPDHEWVAFRASGTEPLFRCYIEAKSTANLKKLRTACRELLA
jgi:phosphomannomutase